MNSGGRNPVWDLYDQSRTARFSVRYYESQLSSLRRNNLWVEVILAVSVSSGITGLWLWQTLVGGVVWKLLVTLAAFLAVVKPLVRLPDQIQRTSEVLAGWRSLDDSFQQLTISVRQHRGYDDEMRNRFLSLMKVKTEIVQKEPLAIVNDKLRERCFDQVKEELPEDSFFVPEEKP